MNGIDFYVRGKMTVTIFILFVLYGKMASCQIIKRLIEKTFM